MANVKIIYNYIAIHINNWYVRS